MGCNYEDGRSRRNKTLVRQDINFLEYPTWTPSCNVCKYIRIETNRGTYTLSADISIDKLPDKIDKSLFYILLDMVGDKGYEVKTTRYELCKRLFGARSSWRYERVEKGLERLAATTIRFQGSFYKDGEYVSAIFHYLDDVQKDDSGRLRIRLSKRLVDWLRETNYVRHIDIIKFMQFKKPVSSRLYEILVKSFEDRNVYRTNILRLRDKLGIQQAFPSHVYREVKLAVDEINRTTELNIKLGYNSKSKVLSFKKIERRRKEEKDGKNAEIDGNYQDENGVIYKVYQVGSNMIMALRLRDNATFTIDMETLNTWSRLKDY